MSKKISQQILKQKTRIKHRNTNIRNYDIKKVYKY